MDAGKNDPGRAHGVQIAGAQQPSLAGQIKDALGVGIGGHDESMFRIFSINVNLPNKWNMVMCGDCLPHLPQ